MLLRPNHSIAHAIKTGTLLIAATVATSLCAQAGTEDTSKDLHKNVIEQPVTAPRFFVSIGAEGQFDYHATKFISNGSADFGFVVPLAVVPAVAVPFGGGNLVALPAKIQSRDFTATHDAGAIAGRLNFGYIVNPLLTVYGGFAYTHSSGDDSRRLGYVTDVNGAFGLAGGRYDLSGDFDEYESYSSYAGAKITLPRTILDFIHAPKFITPYFSLQVGAKYLPEQRVRFFTSNIPAVNSSISLYDDSVVFTAQGGFGYEFKLARNFSINLDTQYGFDTKPDRGDRNLNNPNTTGFNGINKSGDRFYSTVGLSAVYKF